MPVIADVAGENMRCSSAGDKPSKKDQVSAAMLATRVSKDNYMLCGNARSDSQGGDNSDRCDSVSPAECGGCYHNPCARCSPLHPCQRTNGESTSPRTHTEQVPIHKWTTANVLEWMASINLINPVEIFKSKNIDGKELLNLDKEKLLNMGIKDQYIQNMLLLGVQQLRCGEGGAAGEPRLGQSGHSASDHQLKPASFFSLQPCQACGRYLLGTDHQGLSCPECGLVVHRQCAAQPGGLPACERNPANRPPPTIFGAELTQLFQPGRQSAPQLLLSCLAQLERRAQQDPALNCHQLYESCVNWDDLRPVREAVDLDPEGVDLDRFDTSHITSLVKKFLAHLPNPVIPIQCYDDMTSLAERHMETSEGCAAEVAVLVSQLPVHHQSTLRVVMNHVCRLCQLQQERGCRYPPTQLLKTLSFVLIRPPYEQITLWPERTSLHTRLLELLAMNYDWGDQPFPECDPPPALPPRPGRTADSPAGYQLLQPPQVPPRRPGTAPAPARDLALERAEWYWGNISREEVSEKLNGQPDGTFLVRDSQSAGGEYTLTLRKGGNNRMIRIYCRGGKFGFSEPYHFDSVVALVEHYRNHSLRDYNAQLDVRLETPLTENRQYWDKYSTAELMTQIKEAHRRHVDTLVELENLERHRATLSDRLAVQKKAKEAYDEVLNMLWEEQQLHRHNSKKAQLHERNLLADNWKLLESRVQQVQQGKSQVEEEIRRQTPYLKTTEHELSVLHQEERRLLEQRRDLERELVRRGVRRERLECALAGGDVETEPTGPSSGQRLGELEHLWLLKECDRNQAAILLHDRPDGSFLVRRSANGQYALSIVALGQVQNCRIEQGERGFGFSHPYAIYPTLGALVDYYSENELSDHNELLPTRLLYPVMGSQQG